MAPITEMTLGDMFDRVFKLLGRTFVRNLIIGLVVFTPGAALVAFALHHLIGMFLGILESLGPGMANPDPGIFLDVLPQLGLFFLALLVLGAATVLAQVAMMNVVAGEMTGQRFEWAEALGLSTGGRWFRAIGASILLVCAFAAAYVIPILMMVSGKTVLMLLGVLALICALPLILYLYFRWLYIVPVIAWEDEAVLGSFVRSSALVTGMWWRTFGIFLLFSLVFQFAASLVVTPLSFVAMWGMWSEYFRLLGSGSEIADPRQLTKLFSSFGIGYGIIIGLSSLLTTIAQSMYLVVMYFDARARKGEFQPPAVIAEDEGADLNALAAG